MGNFINKRRKYFLFTVILLLSIIGFLRVYSSKQSRTNLQEVFQSIPNESLRGLSNLISDETSKNQDVVFKRLSKVTDELIQKQDERLAKLEQQNELFLNEIRLLRSPPPSSTLREKLAYLFPYDITVRFPGYIWQTWKHGLNDPRFGQKYRDGELQWASKNPGFVHEIFNDDTAQSMMKYLYRQVPEIIEAYEALPEVVLKIDLLRYLILYAKGGVYADIDTYPLQPVPNWIPQNVSPDEIGMIISVGTVSNSPNWRQESVRRLQFGNFVIQAKPGHPILREVIAQIVDQTLERKNTPDGEGLKLTGSSNQRYLEVLKWTGSGIWTDTIMTYFNDYIRSSIYLQISWKEFHDILIPKLVSDVLVLPVSAFASEVEIPKDGKIEDPLAFVKHYASSIWKTS